jgi:hypothetical protein
LQYQRVSIEEGFAVENDLEDDYPGEFCLVRDRSNDWKYQQTGWLSTQRKPKGGRESKSYSSTLDFGWSRDVGTRIVSAALSCRVALLGEMISPPLISSFRQMQ